MSYRWAWLGAVLTSHLGVLTRVAYALLLILGISAISLLESTTIARAAYFYCPPVADIGGDSAKGTYRDYALGFNTSSGPSVTGISGCQWGTGNIEQSGSFTSSNYLGSTPGYVGAGTQPSGTPLANFQTVASKTIGDITLNTSTGTLTFYSNNNTLTYTNVYVAMEDGNGTPRWSLFYIPIIDAATGYVLDAQYLTCTTNANNNCSTSLNSPSPWTISSLTQLSAIEVWGTVTENVAQAPLPGALGLFAAGISLMGVAARKKRKTARLAA
jgi:hypothetical protein